MTRITNVDQVLMLLRQQLQQSSRTSRNARTGQTRSSSASRRQSSVDRLSTIAGLDTVSEDDVGRALIRAMLTDEFGEEVATDPRFQQIINEVHRIITTDPEARRHLDASLQQLRRAAER